MPQFGPDAKIKFKQSTALDVVANRVRFHGANTDPDKTMPYDEVRPQPAPDADGFTRIPLSALPSAVGLDGTFDVAVTAVDDAGQESGFLDIDAVDFDFAAPDAPTEGSVEE